MSQPNADQQQYVTDLHSFAADQMQQGVPRAEIERKLVEHGLDPTFAAAIVKKVHAPRDEAWEAVRLSGRKRMLWGGAWFLGGLALTVTTYLTGGGGARIFWGAMLIGAIQFFRGLSERRQGISLTPDSRETTLPRGKGMV